jgi:hypothetical protein
MRTFLAILLFLLSLKITANDFKIIFLRDTLISDSLPLKSDSLMLSKISTMETELDDISEKLDIMAEESSDSEQNIKKKIRPLWAEPRLPMAHRKQQSTE